MRVRVWSIERRQPRHACGGSGGAQQRQALYKPRCENLSTISCYTSSRTLVFFCCFVHTAVSATLSLLPWTAVRHPTHYRSRAWRGLLACCDAAHSPRAHSVQSKQVVCVPAEPFVACTAAPNNTQRSPFAPVLRTRACLSLRACARLRGVGVQTHAGAHACVTRVHHIAAVMCALCALQRCNMCDRRTRGQHERQKAVWRRGHT
jgi:hypothetical protein